MGPHARRAAPRARTRAGEIRTFERATEQQPRPLGTRACQTFVLALARYFKRGHPWQVESTKSF